MVPSPILNLPCACGAPNNACSVGPSAASVKSPSSLPVTAMSRVKTATRSLAFTCASANWLSSRTAEGQVTRNRPRALPSSRLASNSGTTSSPPSSLPLKLTSFTRIGAPSGSCQSRALKSTSKPLSAGLRTTFHLPPPSALSCARVSFPALVNSSFASNVSIGGFTSR
jgi:hypothetical protein